MINAQILEKYLHKCKFHSAPCYFCSVDRIGPSCCSHNFFLIYIYSEMLHSMLL